jgi:hypothetical protein
MLHTHFTRRIPLKPLGAAVMALLTSGAAVATPLSIFYFKDAETRNNTGGSATTNDVKAVNSTGPTYTQADETMTASGGGATSTTTFSSSIQTGALRATSLSATTGQFNGAVGTGLSTSASQQFYIVDSLTPTGGNVGDAVSLTLDLSLDALVSSFNVPTGNGTLCDFAAVQLYATIGAAQWSLSENLCQGTQHQSLAAVFSAISGTAFDLMLGMNISSGSEIGAGDPFGSSASVDAAHTGKVAFTAPQGYSVTGTTGFDYLQAAGPGGVPEPGTLALVGAAALALLAGRKRPRASTLAGPAG